MLTKALSFEIKSLDDGEGIIECKAAGIGNIDRSGDIILPGAFTDTLERFLRDGVILYQHRSDCPIGKPLECYEKDDHLFLKWQVERGVEKGAECWTLMKAGIVKKFSIGYDIIEGEWLYPDNIESFLTVPATMQEITRALDWGRALKKLELYEVSPVSIPANASCDLTDIKSGLRAGLRFDEYSELVRDANREFVKDAKEIFEMRSKAGRTLSDATRTRLADACSAMKTACGDIDALLEETDPQKAAKRARACRITAEALELEAELLSFN
jgi:HK97 family phage prohead protease